MYIKIEEKDQLVFKRLISAMQSHDSQYAKILTNESSQIRKMIRIIASSKLALKQIQFRLKSFKSIDLKELADKIDTIEANNILIEYGYEIIELQR
jgi:hypothetical protein